MAEKETDDSDAIQNVGGDEAVKGNGHSTCFRRKLRPVEATTKSQGQPIRPRETCFMKRSGYSAAQI